MSKCCTTHYACDCILEKLNNQEQALKQIQEITHNLWKKCFDRSARTVPVNTQYLINQLVNIYGILKPFEIQREENASG